MRGFTRAGPMLLAAVSLAIWVPAWAAAPAPGAIPHDALGIGLDGQAVRVRDFRGRVLRPPCWASGCGPLVRDLELLERLQGVDGRAVRVSDFRGRVLITTFWASWCGPCVRELELLERLQRVAGRDRVVVVGVNWNDSAARYQLIRQRLRGLSLTLTRDDSGRVGERYAVRVIPRMFIVDQDGKLAYSHTGYDPESSIDSILIEVNQLLQHPPVSLMPSSSGHGGD